MADMTAARSVLRGLVKASPLTSKHIAEQVGEEYTTFIHRLSGGRKGYLHLDVGLILAVLDLIGVSFTEYARRVEEADRG